MAVGSRFRQGALPLMTGSVGLPRSPHVKTGASYIDPGHPGAGEPIRSDCDQMRPAHENAQHLGQVMAATQDHSPWAMTEYRPCLRACQGFFSMR
jgi:hypothetical protein